MNTMLILGIILATPLAVVFVTATILVIVGAIRGDKDFQGMLVMLGMIIAFMGGVMLITEALL